MNSTTSGQPRLLSLAELAALIRRMREVYQWSQETLAKLAGLNVRTVQRVENAKSASFDIRSTPHGAGRAPNGKLQPGVALDVEGIPKP